MKISGSPVNEGRQLQGQECLGVWHAPSLSATSGKTNIVDSLRFIRHPLFLIENNGIVAASDGTGIIGRDESGPDGLPLIGYAPICHPENLGNPSFCSDHGIQYPYVGGSMAKGISSAAMVEELGKAGMLGFFGAAGLPVAEVEGAIVRLAATGIPFGVNLIHSPHEPELENILTDLFIRNNVRLIEASAFLALTMPLVRYRVHGIHRDRSGAIVAPNRIMAKVSREELAARFFSPPPDKFLQELVSLGEITSEQAKLASGIPMAQDVTAEADSGGHTDNRPTLPLFPTIRSVATRLQKEYGYNAELRVGLGGGIATPEAAAAAFTLGAAYIMTGSVNQACIESGTSPIVRQMLSATRQADVTMAPAADMFEMGVTVQVLKRGTMFPMRASKLYEIYRTFASIEEIPAAEREKLEKTVFQAKLTDIWLMTRDYFSTRDPRQVERAERDPKHKMALVFRWYLGQAAHWAKDGDQSRVVDYQIWCGPAMGAFNEWVAGSFLEAAENRKVSTVALNIIFGAALHTRVNFLRSQGVRLPAEAIQYAPLEEAQIKEFIR